MTDDEDKVLLQLLIHSKNFPRIFCIIEDTRYFEQQDSFFQALS